MEDKDGNTLKIGDKVRFDGDMGVTYEFTIEEISVGGWIWGSDIPERDKYCEEGEKNHHNPVFCTKINQTPWGKSKLRFHFN